VDNINEVPGPEPAISGEVVDSGPPSRRGPVVVRYGDDVPVTDTFGNVVSDDELEAARRLHREPGLGLPLTFGLSLDDC